MGTILTSVIVLGATGLVAAVVLWYVAKRFHVYEDPNIAIIEEMLPGANCGGCGYTGCHAFATACAEAESMDGLLCPGMGSEGMAHIAAVRGLNAVSAVKKVAVVACAGTCEQRPQLTVFDATRSCAIEASYYGGESGCVYGCLGCGDCANACPYDALHMDPETHLPVVDIHKCVGCAKCVKVCPHGVMELTEVHENQPIVYVACKNRDKGPAAMKECKVSCIGCAKCVRTCESDAIHVTDFCALIDSSKCISCEKCVGECPRHSIQTIIP